MYMFVLKYIKYLSRKYTDYNMKFFISKFY